MLEPFELSQKPLVADIRHPDLVAVGINPRQELAPAFWVCIERGEFRGEIIFICAEFGHGVGSRRVTNGNPTGLDRVSV